MMRITNVVQNDSSSIYRKIISALKQSNTEFKQEIVLRSKGRVCYLPIYVPGSKEVTYIVPEDIFLMDLEVTQRPDQSFNYRLVRGERLPEFFS